MDDNLFENNDPTDNTESVSPETEPQNNAFASSDADQAAQNNAFASSDADQVAQNGTFASPDAEQAAQNNIPPLQENGPYQYNNEIYSGYPSGVTPPVQTPIQPLCLHEEKSYTPPAYGTQPQSSNRALYPVASAGNPRPEKDKKQRPVTRSTVLVACVATALAASILTATIFSFSSGVGNLIGSSSQSSTVDTTSGSSETTSYTSIITESTDEAVIETVAEKVSASVVGVVSTSTSNGYLYESTSSTSQGSGIVYSADGYIITNYHVISNAVENNGSIQVYLPTDTETGVDAEVVGYDVSSDIALLQINQTGLTPIEIGDSSTLKVGQTAIVVGNPGGLKFMGSVSKGIISGLDRVLQLENSQKINLIQTDAAINPGNSGGAMVNSSGQLIGVSSARLNSTDYEGMGFAIPINSVTEICERIIANLDAPIPYVGVEISSYYTSDVLQEMGYPSGVVVSGVADSSPAEQAGIERGDIITEFNGTAVTSYAGFNSEKLKYSPGDEVTLTVYRSGRTYSVTITLGTANS